jgi:hypothetical protein
MRRHRFDLFEALDRPLIVLAIVFVALAVINLVAHVVFKC